MKILVAGGRGQLGLELARRGFGSAVALGRDLLDLTRPDTIEQSLDQHAPEAVINCAAYTQVDRAETEVDLCRAVNVLGAESLARSCERHGVALLHVSTDYVFGGSGRIPRREDDPVSPRGIYASSKYEGEQRTLESCPGACVVRTCGLYDPLQERSTGNFVKTMLRLAQDRDRVSVVNDQKCTPTYVRDLAPALMHLAQFGPPGVVHVTNSGETTWFEFAQTIFDLAGVEVAVDPITTEQFGAAAPRPSYSVLSLARYLASGGPPLRPWREALAAALKDPL